MANATPLIWSNASRTMLFNIHTAKWDRQLLDLFDIGITLTKSAGNRCLFWRCATAVWNQYFLPIPIRAVIGDQQAALYAHVEQPPTNLRIRMAQVICHGQLWYCTHPNGTIGHHHWVAN